MKKNDNFFVDELDKFDKVANDWWNVEGEFKSLHDINPLRMNFIRENVTSLKSKEVLDVGCGGGILSETLYLEGCNVTGIDLSDNLIKIAKNHAKLTNKNIEYKKTSVEQLSKKTKKFDIVVCMELIEHVPCPQSIIYSCSKLLKQDGKFFLSTLNKNLTSYLQAIISAEYILKLVPKKTHDFNKFIPPAILYKMCLDSNLEIKKFVGFSYNIFKKQYYICNNTKVNYLAFAEKS